MLRFPLRLTADLTKARIARALHGDARRDSILVIRPTEEENLSDPDVQKSAGAGLLASVRNSSAPVVWIGGPEPLLYPEMGQLTRRIAGEGRHVFLETDGALLRRRIHEFRPVPRLFLTVRLNGLEAPHNLLAGRGDAFSLALEGIRAARLSGFLICVHARIHAERKLKEIAELVHFAKSLDVDGFVISQADELRGDVNTDGEAVRQKTAEARALIGNRWWEWFSRRVETALLGERQLGQAVEGMHGVAQEADAHEEGVRVS